MYRYGRSTYSAMRCRAVAPGKRPNPTPNNSFRASRRESVSVWKHVRRSLAFVMVDPAVRRESGRSRLGTRTTSNCRQPQGVLLLAEGHACDEPSSSDGNREKRNSG